MKLAEVCVRRPVFATMLVMTFVVLGVFSYFRLGVDLFPKIDMPTVTIRTVLPGASPEEVESQITKPIEEAVNTISGIDELRSSTLEGISIVIVQFVLDKNSDVAAQEVRDKVATVLARLPRETEPPIIERVDNSSPWNRRTGISKWSTRRTSCARCSTFLERTARTVLAVWKRCVPALVRVLRSLPLTAGG